MLPDGILLPFRYMRHASWSSDKKPVAEVVEWQTRTFEGRVAQAVRVQVPPSAPNFLDCSDFESLRRGR